MIANTDPIAISPEELKLKAGRLGLKEDEVAPDAYASYTGRVYNGDLERGVDIRLPGSRWETYDFESPFELINLFDPSINSGVTDEDGNPICLHPWQMEVNEDLAAAKPTSKKPYRFALCAANGSGKDKYVIAPFVVWFAMTKKRSLTVITSSSGVQLTAQTENYIASLCREVNAHFGEQVFKITRRFIRCLKSGSEIRMFATDEAGKAEGYHPLEPGAAMCIIVNEAKTVTPEIFGALSRCTGYSYWINVSTPGEPFGDFYDSYTHWPHKRRVTAFDCPHLSEDHFAEMKRKHGEASFIYRSQILALFTAIGGKVVIDQDFLNACIEEAFNKKVKPVKFGRIRLGIDLAAGRDENAFVASHGNCVIDKMFFQEKDTTITEEKLELFITKHGGHLGKDCDIFADDGGLGHPIIDRLVRKGYNITRVLNQSRAFDNTQFGNRGAEMWYNLARLIQEKALYLPLNHNGDKDDSEIYKQLCYRYYKKNETSGKITLESKEEARANGHRSPDRADAYVLSFCGTNLDEILGEVKKATPEPPPLGETIEQIQARKFEAYRQQILGNGNETVEALQNNSIETYLQTRKN